jgi:hypothetical protein
MSSDFRLTDMVDLGNKCALSQVTFRHQSIFSSLHFLRIHIQILPGSHALALFVSNVFSVLLLSSDLHCLEHLYYVGGILHAYFTLSSFKLQASGPDRMGRRSMRISELGTDH